MSITTTFTDELINRRSNENFPKPANWPTMSYNEKRLYVATYLKEARELDAFKLLKSNMLKDYILLKARPENFRKSEAELLKMAGYDHGKDSNGSNQRRMIGKVKDDLCINILVNKVKQRIIEEKRILGIPIATEEDVLQFFSDSMKTGKYFNHDTGKTRRIIEGKEDDIRLKCAQELAKYFNLTTTQKNIIDGEIKYTIKRPSDEQLQDENNIDSLEDIHKPKISTVLNIDDGKFYQITNNNEVVKVFDKTPDGVKIFKGKKSGKIKRAFFKNGREVELVSFEGENNEEDKEG